MQHDMILFLLISLSLTLVFELLFSLSFKIRGAYDLTLVFLVNFLTNPPVVLTYNILERSPSFPPFIIILLLETAAVLIEGICYKFFARSIRRPFLFSLGANTFSYLAGLLILHVI